MGKIIIPLNAFPSDQVKSKGQAWFAHFIQQTGADGIEIRRELFSEKKFALQDIRYEIQEHSLITVYSAPIELFLEDGMVNLSMLQMVFDEAQELGASFLKVSLGHFKENSILDSNLKELLTVYKDIQLLVENDQTPHGGNIDRLSSFFKRSHQESLRIKMTFDAGNWYYSGEEVRNAIEELCCYVDYVHLKHVVSSTEGLQTVQIPSEPDAEWRKIMDAFPSSLMRALEFPLDMDSQKVVPFVEMVRSLKVPTD